MAEEDTTAAQMDAAIKRLYTLHRTRPSEGRKIAFGALFNLAYLLKAELPPSVLEAIQAKAEPIID